jgi:micrococcal nuclease
MIRLIPSLLLALVIGCSSEPLNGPTDVDAAPPLPTVTRVIVGDTIVVEGVGTVRLMGMDTPETVDPRRPVQYFGKEASDFTKQIATGKRVRLEFDQ